MSRETLTLLNNYNRRSPYNDAGQQNANFLYGPYMGNARVFKEDNRLAAEYRPAFLKSNNTSPGTCYGMYYWRLLSTMYSIFGSTLRKDSDETSVGTLTGLSAVADITETSDRMLIKSGSNIYMLNSTTEGITQLSTAKSVTSITRSGTTATVTLTGHDFVDGDYVVHEGADQSEYNITAQITYISANSYSYEVSGSPATPATGTITAEQQGPSNLSISVGARGIVQLNGATYVPDGFDKIYNSGNDNPTDWAATDFVSAELENDYIKIIFKHHNNLVALGEHTIQFFYDAGNPAPGSPLDPRPDQSRNVGISDANSLWQSGDTTFWIAENKDNNKVVVMLQDFNLRVISNPAIERVLVEGDWAGTASGISIDGNVYYTFDTSRETYVYDVENSVWYIWYFQDRTDLDPLNISHSATDDLNGATYVACSDKQGLYLADIAVYRDQLTYQTSTQIEMLLCTDKFRGPPKTEGLRKFMRSLQVVGDKTSSSQTINISWSDDDYQTFTTARTLDLNTRNRLTRLGWFEERAFRLNISVNKRIRMEALNFDYILGLN